MNLIIILIVCAAGRIHLYICDWSKSFPEKYLLQTVKEALMVTTVSWFLHATPSQPYLAVDRRWSATLCISHGGEITPVMTPEVTQAQTLLHDTQSWLENWWSLLLHYIQDGGWEFTTMLQTETQVGMPKQPPKNYQTFSDLHSQLCQLYCKNNFVDLCDVTNLPSLGDLSHINGMFWRFLPMGDPTVEKFISRDVDSWLLRREREAVREWEESQG